MPEKISMPPDKLKRNKPKEVDDDKEVNKTPAVSAGTIDKITDYAFNPSRDSIRSVTIVDRMQGRLFPQLDMINMGRAYIIEIATYRQDKDVYKQKFKKERPVPPDLLDEFIFRTAQWSKSIAGVNLNRMIDIVLAEKEANAGEDEFGKANDFYKD